MKAVTLPLLLLATLTQAQVKWVSLSPDGHLAYGADDHGNRILDFSNAGYAGGGVALPKAAVKQTLSPKPGTDDDTPRIQAALDELAKSPLGPDGLRGALLLKKGTYRIAAQLKLTASGIVLRGEGQGEDGTLLLGQGTSDRFLISVGGKGSIREIKDTQVKVTDDYVPVGSRTLHVADGSKFKPGDTVLVARVGNAQWIHEIAMDRITPRPGNESSTKQWSPFNLEFDRIITAVKGNEITFDAPIACAIETRWGGGYVAKFQDTRIEHCGVENLRGDSAFDHSIKKQQSGKDYFADENHAKGLVSFDNVKNAWARDLVAIHFYHGVSNFGGSAKWCTVQDSTALDPVSEITGGRRYPFAMGGQLNLVMRCHAVHARHAFAIGSRVEGPNVFLDCDSREEYATSEPHHRWSVGGLYDNVHSNIAFQDRQWMGSGHGWAGANYVAWNCEGSLVCQSPPTAYNWSFGQVGKKESGSFKPRLDGIWESYGKHLEPRSLYLKQLEERLGPAATKALLER